ncbi:MAG TPA: S8 family serine peptidase [bacterium]|nr:S8 family serine peptidase [bacterium]
MKILCVLSLVITGFWFGADDVDARYDCEPDCLEVLFHGNFAVRLRQDQLVAEGHDISQNTLKMLDTLGAVRWERLAGAVNEEQIDRLYAEAETHLGQPVYNMNNIYYLWLNDGQDVWATAESLRALPEVVNAYPVPRPMPLPTPNHEPDQEYLFNSAEWPPTGLNAYWAWTRTGGAGSGVTICDLEYSWNTQHVDLTKTVGRQMNPHAQDPFSDTNHGTAVLGELIADKNGWGVTGICHEADIMMYGTYFDPNPPHTNPQWRLPEAMTAAISMLSAGDVLLLEQQWEYTVGQGNYIPVEWWGSRTPDAQTLNSVYAAIQTAVGNGIHVIEAAGNGYMDLDTLSWYGDSGAIIVAAGGAYSGGMYPAGDLAPLQFTSYGSRVNVHAWGEDVATTGYDTYAGSTGPNDTFCWDFAGTSSASPMVAAAVACCVGYWTQSHLQTAASLTPADMRSILMQTGTPQDTFTTKHIGPRPDLVGAFGALDARAPATFYEVNLILPANFFQAGDTFGVDAIVSNPGPYGGIAPLVVLLEVQGSFWFYPTWSTTFTYASYELFHGAYSMTIIPSFTWPSGTGTANGINLYGALLTPDFSSIWGLYDMETFGFSS